jgi:hypothetical protein
VPRLLSRCEAAVEVSKPPPSCRIYQGAPRLLSKCQGQVDVAIRWESSSNCDTGYTSSAINIYKAFTSKKRACRVGGVKDSEFGSKGYVRFRRRPWVLIVWTVFWTQSSFNPRPLSASAVKASRLLSRY